MSPEFTPHAIWRSNLIEAIWTAQGHTDMDQHNLSDFELYELAVSLGVKADPFKQDDSEDGK